MGLLAGCYRISDEVYYAEASSFAVTSSVLSTLAVIAAANPSGKARICCHLAPNDTLHDMFIALTKKAKILPHCHRRKVESFQVIDGALKLVFYSADGTAAGNVELRSPAFATSAFYYRLPSGLIHSVEPLTECVVFREVTEGPFSPEDTIYPDWTMPEVVR
jgi:cupin fold WbuC family metalloprotein